MEDLMTRLNKIPAQISDESFLTNKGLSNEVGIYVFCYDPKDEITVREFFKKLINEPDRPYRLIECDLYKIFLSICEDKKILNAIPAMEEKKSKDYLQNQLLKIATPDAFVEKMKYEEHKEGDILLITGIGKVYPFMRSHKILDNIQHLFADIPVLMLYPGNYDGSTLDLFGKFLDGNYYRAFNLL